MRRSIREKLRGGDEYDAFTGCRKYISGPFKKTKQRFSRRIRRLEKERLLNGYIDRDG